jgi:GntR family transcriptional repressor for pyruvate dehydrogenase complex
VTPTRSPDRSPEADGTLGVQPRFSTAASHIAAVLRRMIVNSQVADGSALPRQEDLMARFGVSHPPLREALRMLEAEGLITVRRGKRGGSIVHRPDDVGIAYTIGLVLERQSTQLQDVADALARVEPECAALCAEAPDRAERIVPVLIRLNEEAAQVVDDRIAFGDRARSFHDAIIELSGNRTLISVAGALNLLWNVQVARIRSSGLTRANRTHRAEGLHAHEVLVRALSRGDADRARQVMRAHVTEAHGYWVRIVAGSTVDVTSEGLGGLRAEMLGLGQGSPRARLSDDRTGQESG